LDLLLLVTRTEYSYRTLHKPNGLVYEDSPSQQQGE